jgi:hypothetical protein
LVNKNGWSNETMDFRSTGSGKVKFVTTGTIVTVIVGEVEPKSQDQPNVEEMV